MTRAEAIEITKLWKDGNGFTLSEEEMKEYEELCFVALREQEQREQGCEWCYNFQKDPHFYVDEGNGQYTDVVFKFCPVCGRRLED